jgi:hypothetical protein
MPIGIARVDQPVLRRAVEAAMIVAQEVRPAILEAVDDQRLLVEDDSCRAAGRSGARRGAAPTHGAPPPCTAAWDQRMPPVGVPDLAGHVDAGQAIHQSLTTNQRAHRQSAQIHTSAPRTNAGTGPPAEQCGQVYGAVALSSALIRHSRSVRVITGRGAGGRSPIAAVSPRSVVGNTGVELLLYIVSISAGAASGAPSYLVGAITGSSLQVISGRFCNTWTGAITGRSVKLQAVTPSGALLKAPEIS